MRSVPVLLTLLASAVISSSNAHSQNKTEGLGNIVRYAETASLRALNFSQGDLASLVDAKNDFTASGWSEFMKGLDGWLDQNGAPKFSSNFSPSGAAVDIKQEREEVRLTIPGVLRQESRNPRGGVSTTAYRAEIDIQLLENTLKIEHLKQRTCGGAKTRLPCR